MLVARPDFRLHIRAALPFPFCFEGDAVVLYFEAGAGSTGFMIAGQFPALTDWLDRQLVLFGFCLAIAAIEIVRVKHVLCGLA